MARNVTLAQLETRIRWQADRVGATARLLTDDVTREVNESIQRLRRIVSDANLPYYIQNKGVTIAAGAAAAVDGVTPNYGTIDISAYSPAVLSVYGIDVRMPNGEFVALDAVSLGERNDYGSQPGIPVAFTMLTDSTVAVFPPAEASYSAIIRYLPLATALVNSGDTFDGKQGWELWIVWDVLFKLMHRDSTPELIGSIATERDRIETEIRHEASKLQRANPLRRRDTRGDRKRKTQLARWHWYRGG